jgi:hypothetical protein
LYFENKMHNGVLLLCSDNTEEEMAEALEAAAENIVAEFQRDMEQVMDNLEKAELAFDDLSGRMALGYWVTGSPGDLWVTYFLPLSPMVVTPRGNTCRCRQT